MSSPHKKSVTETPESKTLFMPSAGTLASLVETRGGLKMKSRTMRFETPQAALEWAIENRAGFVFFQGTETTLN
jgi:hypothetical protein